MVTKLLKFTGLLLLMVTLTGCPAEEECFVAGGNTQIEDLILLTPFQSTYNQGDIITFSMNVPATNTYFNDGVEINLFEATKDYEAQLWFSSDIFKGNQIEFINGSQGPYIHWFNLIYNDISKNYEFEIKVKLNRKGHYNIFTDESVKFKGECKVYNIATNIIHNEPGLGFFEFTVL